MAEREPEFEEPAEERTGLLDGNSEPTTVSPGGVRVGLMEPEPEMGMAPRSPGLGDIVSMVSGTDKMMEGRLGWTQPRDTVKIELVPGKMRPVDHELPAGGHVKWSVGVAAYDIMVHGRFVEKKKMGDDKSTILFDQKRLGDSYDSHHGALICGAYTADAAGTLQIALDNSCVVSLAAHSLHRRVASPRRRRRAVAGARVPHADTLCASPSVTDVLRRNTDARRVAYSFSNTDYEFTLNRSGLLFATHPETREVTQLDLSEITADKIAKVGSTDMSIELNPRRADEPPRIEGRQLLHFESKSLLHIWYQKLVSMLTSIAERRQHVVVIMQKWARVGMAKREFAAKKRNMLIHDHSKMRSSSKGSSYGNWAKPYAQLKLKQRPVLVTLQNKTREPLVLCSAASHPPYFESGAVWQLAPEKVEERGTGAWGSYAKRPTSGNSGCVLYQTEGLDIVVGFCRPGPGVPGMTKEWTGGEIFPRGESPPLATVWKTLDKEQGGSPRAGADSTCQRNGFVLEWDGSEEGVSGFTLCSEKEYQGIVRAREDAIAAEEAGAAAALARGEQEVAEELIQVQFFNPLFNKFDGAYWRLVPSQNVPQTQVPAWSDSKGRKLGHWKSTPEQIQRDADKRLLPIEGNWQWSDDPWKVDRSGSEEEEGWQYAKGIPHIPGHPCNNMPELPGLGWSPSKAFGSLVRRRTWQRTRKKRAKRVRKNTDLANPFFTTTQLPRFVARIATGTKDSPGPILSVWRPVVAGTKMILGDIVVEGDKPPEKMVAVDPVKVLNSRSEIQREWVKRVFSFNSVWDNGKVFLWRPVVPTVPARFLQRKHLHPLGWIFTTSPAPPDIENVCVIHQDYLEHISDDDIPALPRWVAQGYYFEAQNYANRTLPNQGGSPLIKLSIADEDMGMVMHQINLEDGHRRMEIAEIEQGSIASLTEGLEPGMLLHTIAGQKAISLDGAGIQRLLQQRPLKLAFEKPKEEATLRDRLDADGDGKLSVSDAGALAKEGLKGLGKGIGKLGGGLGKLGGKMAGGAGKLGGNLLKTASGGLLDVTKDDDDAGEESEDEGRSGQTKCDAMFFLERKNKLLYASMGGAMYNDYKNIESFWVLKKDIQPEEETDSLARSSRYTPHLKTLLTANQAEGDAFICSAMMTKKHSSRVGLEMITGSGNSIRAWDVSKGECTRELDFAGAPLTCVASAGNIVFSGSGQLLTGTDISGGKRLPGAAFLHTGVVTCADCVELPVKDSAGRPTLGIVSGADEHDRCIRLWISDEGAGAEGSTASVETPQTFRRVAVPGIGEHRGGVNSVQIWPPTVRVVPHAFRHFRLIVMRTKRQLNEVKVSGEKGSDSQKEAKMPTVGFANFRMFAKTDDDEDAGASKSGKQVKPASVVNLSFAKPNTVGPDDFHEDGSFDWNLPAADPEPHRQNSFLRCATGVVEMHFESSIVPHSYSWEAAEGGGLGIIEKPEHWELFASDDWVSWIKIDGCTDMPLADLYMNDSVSRLITLEDEPAMCLAPFAPPDLRHVPMVVSTGEEAVRVWSICSDYETLNAKKRRAKGVCLSVMRGHTGKVNCCAVTHDGEIVSGSEDNTVRIWQPHGGLCLETLDAGSPVLCVTTFTMSSSVHINDERIVLRSGMLPKRSCTYTIRRVKDTAAIPGGNTFISSGVEEIGMLDTKPGLGEAGEDTFQAYSWRLEPASLPPGVPPAVFISCDKEGSVLYLGHKNGEVVLNDRASRCAWSLEYPDTATLRPANPKNSVGRGKAGAALLKLYTFYRVEKDVSVYSSTTKNPEHATLLLPGTVVQIVDVPVRPVNDQDALWQQVVVVSGGNGAAGTTAGGWMLVAQGRAIMINEKLVPLETEASVAKLRCCNVFGLEPAYLTIGKKPKSELAGSAVVLPGLEEEEMQEYLHFCQEDEDPDLFRFEQASAETTVVAGCEDGTAKIWSNTSANGRWVQKSTQQAVQHAGAIQQVHLVATTNDDDSEGMLLITCSKEVHDASDQTIGVWRIDAGLWECVCRLHPMIVPDYIAGMVKYIDPGSNNDFRLTYADPGTISLTADDLLRIRGDYQSLFEKLVKSLLLEHAIGSIADRSRSRDMDPDLSFKRERKDDLHFEDGDCYYWIQRSASMVGHGPTFVGDQTLTIEDCYEGMVIRDANTPTDQTGGLYRIVSIEDPNALDELTFMEKLLNPQKAAKMALDAVTDLFGDEDLEATITVCKLDDDTGRPDVTKLPEDGRNPEEFLQAAFWEGYSPTPGPDWVLFFFTGMPYDWSVWMRERGIGISRLLLFVLSWPAELWSYRKKLRLGAEADETDDWGDSEEDADWQRLLETAKVGQPVEAMVVPLPGAAGPYKGATADWMNLIKFETEDNHQELSLLHVCVSYCDDHEEEQNSLLALEVPEVVIQYKWDTFGQKKIMEEFRFYVWLVLSFGIFTYRRIEDGFEMGEKLYDHLLALAIASLTISFMWGEVTAVRVGGWADYLPDFWNWLDWTCYIMMLLVVVQSWKLPDFSASWEQKEIICDPWERMPAVMYAIPQLLLWSKVLYFLRAFEETGVFTMMIVRIIFKIRYFIVIMGIMILGFTFTFYIMFNESDRLRVNVDRRAYDGLVLSLITTYNMGVLGDFNMEAFHEQEQETWLLALFFLLTAIVQVRTYERKRDNATRHHVIIT
jgi:hypothetical protein